MFQSQLVGGDVTAGAVNTKNSRSLRPENSFQIMNYGIGVPSTNLSDDSNVIQSHRHNVVNVCKHQIHFQ